MAQENLRPSTVWGFFLSLGGEISGAEPVTQQIKLAKQTQTEVQAYAFMIQVAVSSEVVDDTHLLSLARGTCHLSGNQTLDPL